MSPPRPVKERKSICIVLDEEDYTDPSTPSRRKYRTPKAPTPKSRRMPRYVDSSVVPTEFNLRNTKRKNYCESDSDSEQEVQFIKRRKVEVAKKQDVPKKADNKKKLEFRLPHGPETLAGHLFKSFPAEVCISIHLNAKSR